MPERRAAERRTERFPVVVTIEAACELEGHTLNLSRSGVLLEASGKIPITLTIKGQRYQGLLVRAVQGPGGGLMSYAIQLTHNLLLP
jgi:hypothetical protein